MILPVTRAVAEEDMVEETKAVEETRVEAETKVEAGDQANTKAPEKEISGKNDLNAFLLSHNKLHRLALLRSENIHSLIQ